MDRPRANLGMYFFLGGHRVDAFARFCTIRSWFLNREIHFCFLRLNAGAHLPSPRAPICFARDRFNSACTVTKYMRIRAASLIRGRK